MIGLLLTRWKWGLGIAGALAFLGLALAANHYRHAYHAEKALRKADRAAYGQAQTEAALIAQRALEATEARYRRQADEADRNHNAGLADARSRTDAYLARMRTKAASCPASGAVAPAEDHGAGVPAPVPQELVLVDSADVQRAAEWQTYGLACRAWALTITE